MTDRLIGQEVTFAYPAVFHSLPEYTARRGQRVRVIRRLTDAECDPDSQPMYLIRAADGWEGHAWGDELKEIPDVH